MMSAKKQQKKIIFAIAALALVIMLLNAGGFFAQTIITGNIVSNGDFEGGTTSWTLSTSDPNSVGYTGTFNVLLRGTLDAHYGHFEGSSPTEQPITGWCEMTQTVQGWIPNTDYYVTFDRENNAWFACVVHFQDINWVPTGSAVYIAMSPSASWTTSELHIGQIPASTAYVRLTFSLSNGATGYFNLDNIQMGTASTPTPTPTATPTPTPANPGGGPVQTPTPEPTTTVTPSPGTQATPTPAPNQPQQNQIPSTLIIALAIGIVVVVYALRKQKR